MIRIQEELEVQMQLARATRDHDAILVFSPFASAIEHGTENSADGYTSKAAPGAARLYYVGGSRGNPGVAGAGAVILQSIQGSWIPVWSGTKYLGTNSNNNKAKYAAITMGMIEITKRGIKHVTIIGDSQLIRNQVRRYAAARHEDIKGRLYKLRGLLEATESFSVHHAYREHNTMADFLVNRAMDSRKTSSTSLSTAQPATSDLCDQVTQQMARDLEFIPLFNDDELR